MVLWLYLVYVAKWFYMWLSGFMWLSGCMWLSGESVVVCGYKWFYMVK